MTTNAISIEFGTRHGQVAVSPCVGTTAAPRPRHAFPMTGIALVADWRKPRSDNFTPVSVPGCRGVT